MRTQPDRISRIVAEQHTDPAFCVDRLARLAGVSTVYLREITRRIFRARPHDMIEAFRLGHALRLLTESDLPIDEVGFRSGFWSPTTFRRAFRRRLGCCPSDYRQNKPDELSSDPV